MFTKDDELKFKAFKSVVERAKFEIEGKAIVPVASLIQWFNGLESKIKAPLVPKTEDKKPKRKVLSGSTQSKL